MAFVTVWPSSGSDSCATRAARSRTCPTSRDDDLPSRRTERRPRAPRTPPHLRHERLLLRDGARLLAGMDEVGRGSLAGPVSVGVVVVDVTTRSAPKGVADSKLLAPAARTAPAARPAVAGGSPAPSGTRARRRSTRSASSPPCGSRARARWPTVARDGRAGRRRAPRRLARLAQPPGAGRPVHARRRAGRRRRRACTCGSRRTGRAPPSRPRASSPSASATR